MNKKNKEKITNNYTFTVERIKMRPLTYGETHGINYQMNGRRNEGELTREVLWSEEYEIKEEKVINILKALLE